MSAKKSVLQRVLVIPLRFVGDTVLTVPMIEAMHALWPQCIVDVWAGKVTAPLFTSCTGINRVIEEPNRTEDWTPLLKQGRYDAVVLLRKSWTMVKRCRQAGIPYILGWDMQRFPKPIGFQRWALLVNAAIPYPAPDTCVHQLYHQWGFLQAMQALWPPAVKISRPPSAIALPLSSAAHVEAETLLQHWGLGHKSWVLLHGSSASGQKQLDKRLFVSVIQYLNRQHVPIVLSGLQNDDTEWQAIAQTYNIKAFNACGKTSLVGLAALAQRCNGYIGLDSGPAHLAATNNPEILTYSENRPFVVVYGPTNQAQWAPYGQNIVPVMYSADEAIETIGQRLLNAAQRIW